MKPFDFLQSLLPTFSKTSVIEDCRMTKEEIVSCTQPAFEDALKVFNGRKFEDKQLRDDFATYSRLVGAQGSPNTIVAIEKGLKPMLDTLGRVEKMVEKSYNEEIAGAGVTYYKAAVLQLLEAITFASKYSRRYLNYALVIETAYIDDKDGATLEMELNDAIRPADLRYLRSNFISFCSIMNTLTQSPDKLEQQLDKVPDAQITASNARTLDATVGGNRVDPFSFGLIPLPMNPIYHLRTWYAEWQVDRLNTAKDERSLLALRKLRLERASEGKKDAMIEKQINSYMSRIENLDTVIARKEKAYA